MSRIPIIVIVGPTACGKSALAVELAGIFNAEIVSADSVQVYRFLDIGSAKPGADERVAAAHHLIDVADPDEDYTAARYRADASAAISGIIARGRAVIVAGGTGLYIKALLGGLFDGPGADPAIREDLLEFAETEGPVALYDRLKQVDPKAALAIHPNNIRRVVRALEVYAISDRPISDHQREHAFSESPYDALKIGIMTDRARLNAAIDERVDTMIKAGLADEVRRLIGRYRTGDKNSGANPRSLGSLGYKEIAAYLDGEVSLETAVGEIKKNTRRYAKRQMTWFKKDAEIKWFSLDDKTGIIAAIRRHLA